MKARHHAKHLLKGLAIGLGLAAGILGGALGIFIGTFGWHRFVLDFWPIDNSRIGPNLAASVATVVLITALNEYRTAVRAVEKGEDTIQLVRDLALEVIRPVDTAEEHIAEKVRDSEQ